MKLSAKVVPFFLSEMKIHEVFSEKEMGLFIGRLLNLGAEEEG